MILSDDRRLMEYRNGPLARFLGWFTVALMSAASGTLVCLLFVG